MIYLDYNATTPMHPEVRRKINVYLEAEYGNPSSSHAKGKSAKVTVDGARTADRGRCGVDSHDAIGAT